MKIDLTKYDLGEIADAARKEFDNVQSFQNFSSAEMQVYLIVKGLERILMKKKIDINFDVKVSTKRFK